MARAYRITLAAQPSKEDSSEDKQAQVRFGGSQSEASAHKKQLLEQAGLRPQADAKQVTIEEIDLPTSKAELITFLNKLVS